MKKYIPEHMLSIAASIAPIVITASSYVADRLLATDGIIGWGGLAVSLVSAIILLNSEAIVWKSKGENENVADYITKVKTEKDILAIKMEKLQ